MGAAQHLIGQTLKGTRRDQSRREPHVWTVRERLTVADDLTPGHFSIGYRVADQNGRSAFMKVSDLDLLTGPNENLLERIGAAALTHQFERKILDHCQGNNMDRVVTAIDYGDQRIEVDGAFDIIFFLIFELAEGDIRRQVSSNQRADFLWCLGALHQLAVAIQQLHAGGVSHNDIKPANILHFSQELQKLGDLGSATSTILQGINDTRHDVGDPTYAAPEILYADTEEWKSELCKVEGRRASDLYQLGSIAWFMVTGRMVTPTVVERLAPEHRPPGPEGGWRGRFVDVMPYWREALSRAIATDLEPALRAIPATALNRAGAGFKDAVLQLVECDPALRGHPLNKLGAQNWLGLERYISLFDLTRRDLVVRG